MKDTKKMMILNKWIDDENVSRQQHAVYAMLKKPTAQIAHLVFAVTQKC